MKILRVRRGFTTNSSGDNEYISPTPPPPSPSKTARDASSSADAGTADARSADASPEAAVRDAEADAEQVDAEVASVGVRLSPDTSPAPSGTGSYGSALTLIWVVVGVLVMFVSERVLRLVWRRSRNRADERFGDDDSE